MSDDSMYLGRASFFRMDSNTVAVAFAWPYPTGVKSWNLEGCAHVLYSPCQTNIRECFPLEHTLFVARRIASYMGQCVHT